MTLISHSLIIFKIREILRTLDVGGEQSRQFSREIASLKELIIGLEPGKEDI